MAVHKGFGNRVASNTGSTALSLLHRMWDQQSGVIRVDGIDHRDIKLESLRRNIGVVFQDSTMLYRSMAVAQDV